MSTNSAITKKTTDQTREEAFFRQEIQKTMDAWRYAENHFREATDQDLIDQASYDLLSAKSRYAYLLKQARSRGLSL
ncbi:MAG: YaaL family protein [Firmicutes bacterium]|nr:YaaL family protein [Bacillota bacterium]MBQ6948596.1 YaaL family protein [Bacillota bacterium]MBR2002251.1 YaaL family protein [Bacillota bacterium]MBR7149162.1 YaaL family protein [Bacillota bacterium]